MTHCRLTGDKGAQAGSASSAIRHRTPSSRTRESPRYRSGAWSRMRAPALMICDPRFGKPGWARPGLRPSSRSRVLEACSDEPTASRLRPPHHGTGVGVFVGSGLGVAVGGATATLCESESESALLDVIDADRVQFPPESATTKTCRIPLSQNTLSQVRVPRDSGNGSPSR